MLDGLPWDEVLSKGGYGSIVVATVWMLLTGRLVPRYFYRQKIDECNDWKAAAQESAKQNTQLLEYARTADAILKSLPRGGVRNEVD